MSTALTERLIEAAEAAIRNEEQSLSYEPGRIKGLTLELEVSHNGGIVGGRAYIERMAKTLRRADR